MLKLGERQKLKVVKAVDFGVYLAPDLSEEEKAFLEKEGAEGKVLLPIKQVPEGTKPGDVLEVFLYRDSQDRLIATTRQPKLEMGQVGLLAVVQVNKVGAFLDWGLEKDLFLPYKQQKVPVRTGQQVLVAPYIDKSGRLCATMNVYENLKTNSPYQKDDKVTGTVYEISGNFGAFVAVDNLYSALIPKNELYGRIAIGEEVSARVTRVHEDGKLVLSIREKAYRQMHKDADAVLALLESYGGVLPFTDKASPELIGRETGMSKNEFKRAVGNLLKAGKIQIGERSIRMAGN